MKYHMLTKIILISTVLLFITSCKEKKIIPPKHGYIYKGLYFGTYFTRHYKEGIKDGCNTAKGDYQKKHWLFKNSIDYKDGWFLGRNRCRILLKIDENGDLIL